MSTTDYITNNGLIFRTYKETNWGKNQYDKMQATPKSKIFTCKKKHMPNKHNHGISN